MVSMREFQGKSHADQKQQRLVSHVTKKYLDYPQDFWANILWTDVTKVELFGRCVSQYIWRKTNTAFHKKIIIPIVKHGGSVMVFRTWTTCHNWWNHEFCTLSENPEGEWPAVSLLPQAQAHLGYAAGQWSQTHQQDHLWMPQEKLN